MPRAGSACRIDKKFEFCHRASRSRIADYFAAHNSSYGAIYKSSPHIREDLWHFCDCLRRPGEHPVNWRLNGTDDPVTKPESASARGLRCPTRAPRNHGRAKCEANDATCTATVIHDVHGHAAGSVSFELWTNRFEADPGARICPYAQCQHQQCESGEYFNALSTTRREDQHSGAFPQ